MVTGQVREAPAVLRRRQLLRGGFWAGMGVLGAGSLAAAVDFLNPHVVETFGTVVTVPPNHVPSPGGAPYYDTVGKFWLVNLNPGEGVPEEFLRIAAPSHAGGLVAFYQKCTHLGCAVAWLPDYEFATVTGWFYCRCHFATFTKAGVRVYGPAPRSMDRFAIVEVSEGGIRVNTGQVLLGDNGDPQHVVPAGPFAQQRAARRGPRRVEDPH